MGAFKFHEHVLLGWGVAMISPWIQTSSSFRKTLRQNQSLTWERKVCIIFTGKRTWTTSFWWCLSCEMYSTFAGNTWSSVVLL
jgi:hypothetical protein